MSDRDAPFILIALRFDVPEMGRLLATRPRGTAVEHHAAQLIESFGDQLLATSADVDVPARNPGVDRALALEVPITASQWIAAEGTRPIGRDATDWVADLLSEATRQALADRMGRPV